MTWHRFSSNVAHLVPVFAVIVLFASVEAVGAQASVAGEGPVPTTANDQQGTAMMAEFQKIMAALSASDQKLGQLIAAIDTSKGDDNKIEAITAVLKEMAAQRTTTREQIVAIGRRMMGHMTEHMSGGMQGTMNCPMMKAFAKPAEPDHSQHHPEQ